MQPDEPVLSSLRVDRHAVPDDTRFKGPLYDLSSAPASRRQAAQRTAIEAKLEKMLRQLDGSPVTTRAPAAAGAPRQGETTTFADLQRRIVENTAGGFPMREPALASKAPGRSDGAGVPLDRIASSSGAQPVPSIEATSPTGASAAMAATAARLCADWDAASKGSAPSLSLFTAVHADADRLRQRLHDEERRHLLNARQARVAALEDNRRRDASIETLGLTTETLRQMVKSLMDSQVSPDLVASLSQRIDAAHDLGGQLEARQSAQIGLIADQVRQLAERMDRSDEALSAAAAMQRSVFDYVVELGDTQSALLEDVRLTMREEMHGAVAAEIAKLRTEELTDRSAASQLRDEMNAMRAMRSESDQQLQSILSLLGDSLERVADRVVRLEEHACDGIGLGLGCAEEARETPDAQPDADRIVDASGGIEAPQPLPTAEVGISTGEAPIEARSPTAAPAAEVGRSRRRQLLAAFTTFGLRRAAA